MSFIKVTYRDIAKMLVKSMPIQDAEFGLMVEEYIEVIKGMAEGQIIALKTAYVFSRKVPREEREDMFQDLTLAILKAEATDERLAYAVARCDWRDWWEKYRIRQHYSLDSIVEDSDGNQIPYAELLVGECEFENKMNGEMDGQKLYDSLPPWIREIVKKRLLGKPIRGYDRRNLDKWVSGQPTILAQYQN